MEKPDLYLKNDLTKSSFYTVGLSIVFLVFTWKANTAHEIFFALPYFIILCFLFFSIGKPRLSTWIYEKINNDIYKAYLFPTFLIILLYSWVLINGYNPFQGTMFLVPYLIVFPSLIFTAKKDPSGKIGWLDFTTYGLFLLPITLIELSPDTNLPFNGGGFDSVYRLVLILSAVYAFVIIRNLKDVGFYPVFKWKYLWIAIWVWLAFYAFVFIIGYSINFIRVIGHDSFNLELFENILRKLISVFLHTAIFEELFFRGLFQNMLSKRIAQSGVWKKFWLWGSISLLIISLLTGYLMEGNMFWFPALIAALLFLAAYVIELKGSNTAGAYTALAITSVIFGLVHYHGGSIIFVGLACIGGWAYGYTYIKTKNVFYAALVHALVNSSLLIFGLELM